MKNSIESIWKEGFLKNDALVAPKLNDLYNQKSIHIIDRFKRMFRINYTYVIGLAFLHLIIGWIAGVPLIGIFQFLLFIPLILYSKNYRQKMEKIDKSLSSFEYLKTFDNWLKETTVGLTKIYRFFYPLYFLGLILGILYTNFFELFIGDTLINKIMSNPDTKILFGLPIYWVIPIVLLLALLSFLGGSIYKVDLKAVYGPTMNKLEELISDMEELRK